MPDKEHDHDRAVLTALTKWRHTPKEPMSIDKHHLSVMKALTRYKHSSRFTEVAQTSTLKSAASDDIMISNAKELEWDRLNLPRPTPKLRHIFSKVRELFIAGGGGAGRSLPKAMSEAVKFGLDLSKVEVVCATSVGTIMGLGIVLNMSTQAMSKMLDEMPTEQFQDWSVSSITDFFQNWGLCEGKFMPSYFRKIIKHHSGLNDPSFEELYAKSHKEFRVIVANVSKKKMTILSHKTTPKMKVAEAVGLSCSVPILYPPKWFSNEKGDLEAFADGGIIKNYPWGVGSDPNRPLEEQLGFIFVNNSAAYALNDDSDRTLIGFRDYLCNLLTMAVFQDPLCLSDSVKARTVAISLGWNPLKFSATPEEQRGLDKAGKQGTRRLVKQILKSTYHVDANDYIPQMKEKLVESIVMTPVAKQWVPRFARKKSTNIETEKIDVSNNKGGYSLRPRIV
ncbi:MAG: patatin-like phospholipase family protein [Candidatus Berkiella sp.]